MPSRLFLNVHPNAVDFVVPVFTLYVFGQPEEVVTIENAAGFSDAVTLDATGFGQLDLPNSVAMTGTGVNDQGLEITAEGAISASFSNRADATTDLTIVFEEATLGSDYVLASASTAGGEGGQFSVQALDDGTVVTYTLPDGQTGTVTLNAGQTFKFATQVGDPDRGVSTPVDFDLTGTMISASADVAVFSGHDCADVPETEAACDHLIEQMPPISALSTDYIVGEAFNEGTGPNLVRVVAAQDGTVVTVDGTEVATLDAGQFHEFTTTAEAARIQTSQPALVAQYLVGDSLAGEGDPAMSFVPGTDTWLSEYDFASPTGAAAFAVNLVNVVIPTDAIGSLMINGSPVDATAFTPISDTALSVANLAVPAGRSSAVADAPFQLSLFGYAGFDSYLTFGAASFASGTVNVAPQAVDDTASTRADTPVTIAVLDNDSDADGDTLTITAVGDPANGTTTISEDTIVYTPDPGFLGTEAFTYTIDDGNGETSTATVTVSADVMTPLINGLGGDAGFGENSVSRNDDGFSQFIDLSSVFGNGLNFFGQNYTGLYVNTNGSVTFDNGLSQFTPDTISGGTIPGIFPFWADVDTRSGTVTPTSGGTSTGSNLVWYDLDADDGTFTVTWDDVGYYSSNTDRLNAFQLIITDLSGQDGFEDGDFTFEFRYEDIGWTTGDASDGSGGLDGSVARAGYSAGNDEGTHFELPQSGNQAAILALDEIDPFVFVSTTGGVIQDFEAIDDGGVGFATSRGARFTTVSVFDNDRFPDDRHVRAFVSSDDDETRGRAYYSGDGTFLYDPGNAFDGLAEGETATDTFSYTLIDQYENMDEAEVTVTIYGSASDVPVETMVMGVTETADLPDGVVAQGTLDGLNGMTVPGVDVGEEIVFQGASFDRSDVSVAGSPPVLSIDADGDGTVDSAVTVDVDLDGGDFVAVRTDGATVLSFERFLPSLSDAAALDADAVNGLVNDGFFTGTGATVFDVSLHGMALAGYDNALGVYEVAADGTITDVRLLVNNLNAPEAATIRVEDVEASNRLGFFVVQDGGDWAGTLADSDTLAFVEAGGDAASVGDGAVPPVLTVDGVEQDLVIFLSDGAMLNPDGLEHFVSGVVAGGDSLRVGVEDLLGGGDRDFQDIVFDVTRIETELA